MIIICQSIKYQAREITEILGDREYVRVVSGAREATKLVVDFREHGDRTVVVSSNHFHELRHSDFTGAQVARRVKEIDPKAWFFLYSTMWSHAAILDGIIPKEDLVDHDMLIRFVDARLDTIDSLEDLNRRQPRVLFI